MAFFYRIQIDEIYLTKNGLVSGLPCKLSIPNVEDLLTTTIGRVEPSANGTPIYQILAWTKNKPFEIKIDTLLKDVWEDLKTLINDSLENNASFSVIGSGDIGDFNVDVRPNPVKPFQAESFINSRIKGVTLRFITI